MNEKKSKETKYLLLKKIYENPISSASFSGIEKLYLEGKKLNSNITKNDVINFLKSQDSYTLHKLSRKKFKTRSVLSSKPKVIIGLDLIDLVKLSKFNDNFKFLLYFIDLFSKKVTVLPLKNKNKFSLLAELKTFFNIDDNYKYSRIYSDYEPGLYSKDIK